MLLSRASALALALTGCAEPLSADECSTLLDRYVTLIVASDRPGTSEPDLVKLRAEARRKAARDPSFALCPREVSRGELECALSAPNTDLFEQCLL